MAVATGQALPPRAGAGLPGVYTYHFEGDSRPAIGALVEVPFGSRTVAGVVVGWPEEPPDFPTRPLERVLSPGPLVSTVRIELARFVARTYRTPLYAGLTLVLPPGSSQRLKTALRSGSWSPPTFRSERPNRSSANDGVSRPAELSGPQEAARDAIVAAARARQAERFLLYGVTGSGKTLVYLEAAAEIVAAGQQVIILVSEIGLTTELIARFQRRFPGQTVLLHSELKTAEHFYNWDDFAQGRAMVAIGPRSAIFAPAQRLGLVVIDEEHDWAYKQDHTPRYHARSVALELGRLSCVPVVLSSATPDVETAWQAREGALRLLHLPGRFTPPGRNGAVAAGVDGLPETQIVDLRAELRAGNGSMFSRALRQALEATLERGEQAILFLNRRGSATCVTCRHCGHVVSCRRCEVPLVYHREGERLVCHRCNRRRPPLVACPSCGSAAIRHFGVGTQRVEEELRAEFPEARILRWDRDASQARRGQADLWEGFRRHEADVLVGTQLVAKALDFPLVTLVGVILADVGLYLPDFRAPERSFQLLTQVAGRAGRAERAGRVVVQTYSPDHYAIRFAAAHDYRRFFEQEIAFRREQGYPPFGRLVRLVYSDSDERRCWRECGKVRRQLEERIEALADPELRLIGPAPCFAQRVRGRYRWQLVVRGVTLDPLLDGLVLPAGWIMDVDPVNLL